MEPFSVSLFPAIEKFYASEGCHSFMSKFFCLTVSKNFVGEFFCFVLQELPVAKLFIDKRRGGVSKFSVENLLSHSAKKCSS